jgi:quercetin dioxygenase-like cupin family protein
MSEHGYEILTLDEIEPAPYHSRGGEKLLTVERLLDYPAAGVNAWIGDPGERLVPEHHEDSEEELYVVVRGRATFTIDEQTVDGPAGTFLHVTARETRTAVAEEPGTIVLAVGGTPGVAHEPSGWTSFVVADALRRAGRIEEGRAAIREMIAVHPGAWHAPYNAACYEALAGQPDAAFDLLQQAIRIDAQSVRRFAAGDSDLDSLHDDPRWHEVGP